MAQDKSRKRQADRFRRRRINFLKKAELLRKDFGVQVYVLVHAGDKYFTYTSTNGPNWPPTQNQLVGLPHLYFIEQV